MLLLSIVRMKMIMIRIVLSVLVLCALFSMDLNGSSPIIIEESSRKIYVEEMNQFIDSSSSLTFEDFKFNRDAFFESVKDLQGTRNRNFTYWLAFEVSGSKLRTGNYNLLCTDSRISYLEVWIDGEPQTDFPVGTDFLFDNRSISHSNFVFRLPKKETLEVVFKINSKQASFFAFEVKSENDFLRDSTWGSGALGSAYGVFVLSLFFSILMGFRFKDSIYGAYTAFVFLSMLTCLFLDGGGFHYFWGDYPKVNFYLLLFLPVAILFSCGALVVSFFEIWDRNDFYFRLIGSSLFFVVIGYAFAFTIPQYYLHNIFYMIPFGVMVYICIVKYRLGNKSSLPFIVGFVFVIMSNALYMIQPFVSVGYFHYIIKFSPHYGVVALTLCLSYSQYMKFYYISESRKEERKKSIQRLEQLSDIKDGINEQIAEKVALQTEELERKNAIIHQQNADLQYVNDKLKEQTDEIVILNLKLNQENQELKSDVEKITESRIMQNTIPFDDFKKFFDSDDSCYAMLEGLKWQNGFECLKCKNAKYGKGKGERARRCTKCGVNESVTSNTIFHRIHFPILKGFYMLFLVNKHGDNLISKDLSEIVDLRLATCWKFSKKIKARIAELQESGKVIESWLDLI